MRIDSYIFDTLMRDLIGHDRATGAYLVYLQLYRHSLTHEGGPVTMSHSMLAELTGLSKRSVQNSVDHLTNRHLISKELTSPTSVPRYTVAVAPSPISSSIK